MKIQQFLKQLERARKRHSYDFRLEVGVRIVPRDDPPSLATVEAYSIRCATGFDARSMQPVEVVWHCYHRKSGLHLLPGRAYEANQSVGLTSKWYFRVMAAAEEHHLSPLDPKNNQLVRRLRKDLLKACGLQAPQKRRVLGRQPLESVDSQANPYLKLV